MALTTFKIYFRISHSLPQLGEVEKHGHSISLELSFRYKPSASDKSSHWLKWRSEIRSRLIKLQRELDGNWIDDYLNPATSENLLLYIYKKLNERGESEGLVALALQETSKNRFVLKTV